MAWGWAALDNLSGAPDAAGKGQFIEYFLRRMQEAEEESGQRLIDYVDVHWYPDVYLPDPEDPERDRRVTSTAAFEEMVDLRLQVTRSLWDATYIESSWFAQMAGSIRLIPWLRDLVEDHYPGTKLAITEWHYGAGHHISGGIAHADALGAFGREGVSLSTLWPHRADEAYIRAAYRLYRNYAGEGSAFGDQAVRVKTDRNRKCAVYAATSSEDEDQLNIIVINRTAEEQATVIEVEHATEFNTARLFTLTDSGPEIEAQAAVTVAGNNRIEYVMPPRSASLFELTE